MRFLLLVIVAAIAVSAERRFDGNSVLRIQMEKDNAAHNHVFQQLLDHDRDVASLWCNHDVQVNAGSMPAVTSMLNKAGITYDVMIDDVQRLIDEQKEYTQKIRAREADGVSAHAGADPFFNDFRNLTEMYTWFAQQAAAYPKLVTVNDFGLSYEKRAMKVITITSAPLGTKPVIYWEGGIHAREWIAHATMCYMISKLTTDSSVANLLANFEFKFVPVVNPDGYEFTWTTDRSWRKTRSPNVGSPCVGTDPNRNWDDHWCEMGASTFPCSDSYCGVKAFSEIEVANVANLLLNITKTQKVMSFIDYHSYGQLYMAPYGWSASPPADAADQAALGEGCCAAIKSVNNMVYSFGRIYEIIYPASGTSADWGYDIAKIKYSYGIELRDTGKYGFLLPANQITPQGEEIWASLIYTAKTIASELGIPL